MGRSYVCPYCAASGPQTIAKGFRKTKTIGLRRVRFCKACKRKFTPKHQPPVQDRSQEAATATDDDGAVPTTATEREIPPDPDVEPWTSS